MNTKRFLKKIFLKGNEIIRNVAEKNSFICALYKALVLPVNVAIFRANRYKVGTAVLPKFVEEIHKNIEKFVPLDVRNNPKKRKAIEKDIVSAYFTGYFFPEEFFQNHFQNKSFEERSDFISEQVKDSLLVACSKDKKFEHTKNKAEFYKITKPYFHREACFVSEDTSKEAFETFVERHPKFIAKPVEGSTGVGTTIIEIHDKVEMQEVYSRLIQHGAWFLEELIIQHPDMAQWNPTSVNTLRVPTFRAADGCRILQPFFRTGRKGSIIDNAGQGGVFAVFDPETGVIITDGVDEYGGTYELHPDSKLKFKGWQIPQYDELKKLAAELIHLMPWGQKYVGFDFALSQTGWVLVEGNSLGQFVGQIAEQKGVRKTVMRYLNDY